MERGVVSTSGARLTARLGRETGFGEGGGGEEETASGSGSDTSTGGGVRECFRRRRRLRGGEAARMAVGRRRCLREGECRLREGRMVASADNKEPRTKTKDKKENRRYEVEELTRSGTVDQRRHQGVLWGIRDRHCWNVFYRDSRTF